MAVPVSHNDKSWQQPGVENGTQLRPSSIPSSLSPISRSSSSSSWHSSEGGSDWSVDISSSVGGCERLVGAQKGSQSSSRVPHKDAFRPPGGQEQDVLLRLPPCAMQSASPLLSPVHSTVPFNDLGNPVLIDTPLFHGTVTVLLKNLPSTPGTLFKQRKRHMWFSIQGRFKQPVSLDSLMLGSEFERPLQLPAAALLVRAANWLVQRMGSGVQLSAAGQNPHILAPLVAAAQIINVSLPGQEPSLFDAEEDMALVDSSLVGSTGQPLAPGKRKSHFSSKAARAGRYFSQEHVWTFQVWDQGLDYGSFQLAFPLFKLDLVQVLAGQPLQLMLKDTASSQYMMNFEVWHKRMLQHKANLPAAAAPETDHDKTGGDGSGTARVCGRVAAVAAAGTGAGVVTVRSYPIDSSLQYSGSDIDAFLDDL